MFIYNITLSAELTKKSQWIWQNLSSTLQYPGGNCQARLQISPWVSGVNTSNIWIPVRHRNHDDVIKWEHFLRYWLFVREIHQSPVNSPHKGQWRGALMFTLICARINGKQAWGWWFETLLWSLWRHCNDMDKMVLISHTAFQIKSLCRIDRFLVKNPLTLFPNISIEKHS